ncbi:unnamed protein product [Timema podura]|uniref:Uncharacterized protein n=1 Tax=Timema podura TaxID=61482 RepID=A0ABN7NR42_TIMPD|nr:unnamed protein product [Timema podura]
MYSHTKLIELTKSAAKGHELPASSSAIIVFNGVVCSDSGYKTAAKDILWEELATPQTPTVQEVKSKLKDINLQEDPNNITKFEDYLESGLDINFKFMNPHIFDKMTIIQLEDATKQPKNINKNKSTASEIPGMSSEVQTVIVRWAVGFILPDKFLSSRGRVVLHDDGYHTYPDAATQHLLLTDLPRWVQFC